MPTENQSKPSHNDKMLSQIEVYNTRYSQAVSRRSTTLALQDLTTGIGRDPVFCLWYGRRRKKARSCCVF